MTKYKMVWRKIKGKPRRAPRRRRNVRRKRAGVLTTINRSLQPVANRYLCKMKYATTVNTDLGGQYIFNLNSLYDPDRSGLGHQPYGYDQLATLYNRYRVISCGWRAYVPSTTTGSSVVLAAMPSNDTGILWTNFGEMAENPRTKYVQSNPGGPAPVLTGKVYLPTLMGRTRTQYMSDDNYQAVVTTNPAELGLLYIQTLLASTGGASINTAVNIVLEYTCEFFDLKHMVQS